jgi:hypothetical protein
MAPLGWIERGESGQQAWQPQQVVGLRRLAGAALDDERD